MDEERIAQIRGEWMQEVVKLLYGRMNRLNEILRLTREICSALDRMIGFPCGCSWKCGEKRWKL